MLKNILLGYNGSRGAQVALSQAVSLAAPAKARLHVTSIVSTGAADPQPALPADSLPDAGGLTLPDVLAALPDDHPDEGDATELESIAESCRNQDVFCTFNHHYGEPGPRLVELSRVANLLVLARRDEPQPTAVNYVGRVARHVATHPLVPTLFTDREHLAYKSATLFYEARPAGGRALALAGEIADLLNITLNVVCLRTGYVEAAAAEQEARVALRAYHLDGEFVISTLPLVEALQSTVLSFNDPLIILPAPVRQLLFTNHDAVRVALGQPNTNVLLVP